MPSFFKINFTCNGKTQCIIKDKIWIRILETILLEILETILLKKIITTLKRKHT